MVSLNPAGRFLRITSLIWLSSCRWSGLLFRQGLKPKKKKPLFMRQINQKRATVYLLGAIHALNQKFYPLPPTIEKAFSESERLAVEADIADTTAQVNLSNYQFKYGLDSCFLKKPKTTVSIFWRRKDLKRSLTGWPLLMKN